MEYIIFAMLMFTGGFVDAIAGGGGIITLPAYLSLGIPLTNAVGTNKLSASFSTIASFIQYLKSNKLKMKIIIRLVPFSFAGSVVGVMLFYSIRTEILEKVVPFIIIAVGIYSLINKNMGVEDNYKDPNAAVFIKGALPVFFIGMYDGFIGPGTGIFFILVLIKIFKMDFIGASGGTKLLNVVSGLTAFFIYALKGSVLPYIGIAGFFCSLAGSIIGSKLAIKNGAKFIKPIFCGNIFCIGNETFHKSFLNMSSVF